MSVIQCRSLLTLFLCSLVKGEGYHACGDSPIRTVNYLCVEPKVKSCNQTKLEGIPLVFRGQGSERNCTDEEMQFRYGFDGIIVHKCSNMMVCPEEEKARYDSLVFRKDGCDPEIAKFNRLPTRLLQNRKTGSCVHPRNGRAYDGVDLHFYPTCGDADNVRLILFKLESPFPEFDIANWKAILDRSYVWATCNSQKQYLQGMSRSQRVVSRGLGLIEYGGCSSAPKPYTNQDSYCQDENWFLILNGDNIWATCPSGHFLQGFYKSNDRWLHNIERGRCCKPVNHPDSWGKCYHQDVSKSFNNQGGSFCKEEFFLVGIYKSDCEELKCIEKFKCCRMKKKKDAFGLAIKETKHDCQNIKIAWEPALKQSGPKVTQVDVAIKNALGVGIKKCSAPVSSQECILSGLKVGENYTVRVSATNECKERASLAPKLIRMEPTELPDGVQSMHTDVKGCTILVMWTSPNTTCPITGYVVYYRKLQDRGVQENWTRRYIVDATATMYKFTLQCGMRYEVGITTKNTFGESRILTQVTDLPSNPTHSRYFGTATIVGITVGCFLFFVICFAACFVVKKRIRERGERKPRPTIEVLDNWEILPQNMTLLEEVGEGAFGRVHKATLIRMIIAQGLTCQQITVAVKTLRNKITLEEKILFQKEIDMMKRIGKHKNIVSMIGCVTLSEPMQLILEYVPHGNLLDWLRRRKAKNVNYENTRNDSECFIDGNHEDSPVAAAAVAEMFNQHSLCCTADGKGLNIIRNHPSPFQEGEISGHRIFAKRDGSQVSVVCKDHTKLAAIKTKFSNPRIFKKNESENDLVCSSANKYSDGAEGVSFADLLSIAWQITQGMEYISAGGFVHRDLAARNILVSDNKTIKITDFGMARDLDKEIYEMKNIKKIPVKWMPPETLQKLVFTAKSDVWSYGIVLWEIATFGVIPYTGVNNREMNQLLKSGYRLEKPEMCSDELYDVMRQCWKQKPAERPSFTQIRERLETIMQADMPYLDLWECENEEPTETVNML